MSSTTTTPATTEKPIPGGLVDESKLLLCPSVLGILCLFFAIYQSISKKQVKWFGILMPLVTVGGAAAMIWKNEDMQDKRQPRSGWFITLSVCVTIVAVGCQVAGGAAALE